MKTFLNFILTIITLLFVCSLPVVGDSLLKESEGLCDLYGSRTAFREGDIISIVFNESTVANQSAKGKLKNSYKVGADEGKGFLQKFLGLGMSGGETTDVETTTTQTHSLDARITAVVKEVLPNGYLRIEGAKSMEVNHETQRLTINGIVRPTDITYNNTVESSKIAEMVAHVNGLPIDRSVKQRRGGILRWVWNLLF